MNMTYLINYDLKDPGQRYLDLTAAIKSYGVWAKISYSCWAVRTELTAEEIRDDLIQYIDSNDVLFVCQFDGWASFGLSREVVDWLNN